MEGIDLNRYTKSYSLVCSDEPEHGINPRKPQFSANTQSLLMLNGILEGITCDNVLTPEEINYLSRWMHANEALKGNYPYDKIFSILSDAMEDGVLEAHELAFMLEMFQQLADPVKDCGCSGEKLTLTGKTVCLSGEFDYGAKSSVSEKLVALGAYIHESVTKKTDYLLVGGQGSSAWAAGNYGTKIKKALELQGKGMEIVIIREADFFNALES
jgi:DNA polymerase-3 subunit alpha (Gram-positive type)